MKPTKQNLGCRLKWIRCRYGLSLEEFGKSIRVGKSYASKLERGVNESPSEHVIDAICRMFSVRRDWLTSGDGDVFTMPHLNDWPESKPITKPFVSEGDLKEPKYLHAFVIAGELLVSDRSPTFIVSAINTLVDTPRLTPDLTIAVVKILSDELLAQLKWIQNEFGGNLGTSYSDCISNEGKLAVLAAQEARKTKGRKSTPGLDDPSDLVKSEVDSITVCGNTKDVKAKLPTLLARLNKVTSARGAKSELAKYMGVPPPNVSQWLSGEREPSGETTLQLLNWVERQERKK